MSEERMMYSVLGLAAGLVLILASLAAWVGHDLRTAKATAICVEAKAKHYQLDQCEGR